MNTSRKMKFVNQRNKVEGSQEAHFASRLQGGGKGEILVEIVFMEISMFRSFRVKRRHATSTFVGNHPPHCFIY
jgi:hypothetical protein